MSIHGKRSLSQTVLAWEFYKTLNEYGEPGEYNKGWTLNLDTALGELYVQWCGKPHSWRKLFSGGFYVSKGCIIGAGVVLDYDPPQPLEWNYSGDALPPRS